MATLRVLLCVFVWLTPVLGSSQENKAIRITVDPMIRYQTMDGFGASDAWRCQFVGKNWPLEKRERIADLLFSKGMDSDGNPKGIGLSIWRFNVSAGTAEQGEQSGIRNPWRRGECFQGPDGSYDWSKQAGQQWFLKAAQDRGVEKLLAFPNAPPVHLTRNGKGYASKGIINLNLQAGKMDDYAAFMADVIAHFEEAGVHFDYLSPFNEPQWNWDGPGQEGTPALNEELYALVKCLSKELSERGLSTRLLIGEAGTIGHIAKTVKNDGRDNQAEFFFDPTSPFYIGELPNVEKTISAHSYHTVWPLDEQVEHRRTLKDALRQANPELGYWQSEYCILQRNGEIISGGRRDLGMPTALYVARIIHNDLTLCDAKSWQWWTAVSQCDYKDGLVYLDDGSKGQTGRMGGRIRSLMRDGQIRESKLLWVMGNYSRFVRPGMVRVGCDIDPGQSVEDGLLVSAFTGSSKGLVLVCVNLSTEDRLCDLGLSKAVEVHTTSSGEDLGRSRQDASGFTIPARAVATVLLSDWRR
jgi:O-glycosyl hydrolase